jgi:hypothetical protein
MSTLVILMASLFLVGCGKSACEQDVDDVCACEGDLAEAACSAAEAMLEEEVTDEMEESCEENEISCDDFEVADDAAE